jgi:hypothetical protein
VTNRIPSLVFALGLFAQAAPVSAACVRVALLDDAGSVIKPNGLVIAVMVGESPIFARPLPPHRDRRIIGATECAPEDTKPLVDLYNLSCSTEQTMRQASENNATSFTAVLQRCAELKQALE